MLVKYVVIYIFINNFVYKLILRLYLLKVLIT